MNKRRLLAAAEAWDVGARVAIFGTVDSERWATLGPLVQRALEFGHAVVVGDQGLDPLADHLETLAGSCGVSLRRWPDQQAGTARGWREWRRWPGRGPAGGLPPLEDLLWIDLPASGLDVAGFVEAVHGWRLARAGAPVVVVAHDLAWRDDAGALLGLWDAASSSDGRLCAMLTAPGLPNEPRLRSALLEASLVGVHRLDSHTDAVILADYLNQPLADGVEAHGITVHDHSNVLPIAEFWLTLPDNDLPLVLVDATGRPDFVDLFRVTAMEGGAPGDPSGLAGLTSECPGALDPDDLPGRPAGQDRVHPVVPGTQTHSPAAPDRDSRSVPAGSPRC
jgi:hypothetical protein